MKVNLFYTGLEKNYKLKDNKKNTNDINKTNTNIKYNKSINIDYVSFGGRKNKKIVQKLIVTPLVKGISKLAKINNLGKKNAAVYNQFMSNQLRNSNVQKTSEITIDGLIFCKKDENSPVYYHENSDFSKEIENPELYENGYIKSASKYTLCIADKPQGLSYSTYKNVKFDENGEIINYGMLTKKYENDRVTKDNVKDNLIEKCIYNMALDKDNKTKNYKVLVKQYNNRSDKLQKKLYQDCLINDEKQTKDYAKIVESYEGRNDKLSKKTFFNGKIDNTKKIEKYSEIVKDFGKGRDDKLRRQTFSGGEIDNTKKIEINSGLINEYDEGRDDKLRRQTFSGGEINNKDQSNKYNEVIEEYEARNDKLIKKIFSNIEIDNTKKKYDRLINEYEGRNDKLIKKIFSNAEIDNIKKTETFIKAVDEYDADRDDKLSKRKFFNGKIDNAKKIEKYSKVVKKYNKGRNDKLKKQTFSTEMIDNKNNIDRYVNLLNEYDADRDDKLKTQTFSNRTIDIKNNIDKYANLLNEYGKGRNDKLKTQTFSNGTIYNKNKIETYKETVKNYDADRDDKLKTQIFSNVTIDRENKIETYSEQVSEYDKGRNDKLRKKTFFNGKIDNAKKIDTYTEAIEEYDSKSKTDIKQQKYYDFTVDWGNKIDKFSKKIQIFYENDQKLKQLTFEQGKINYINKIRRYKKIVDDYADGRNDQIKQIIKKGCILNYQDHTAHCNLMKIIFENEKNGLKSKTYKNLETINNNIIDKSEKFTMFYENNDLNSELIESKIYTDLTRISDKQYKCKSLTINYYSGREDLLKTVEYQNVILDNNYNVISSDSNTKEYYSDNSKKLDSIDIKSNTGDIEFTDNSNSISKLDNENYKDYENDDNVLEQETNDNNCYLNENELFSIDIALNGDFELVGITGDNTLQDLGSKQLFYKQDFNSKDFHERFYAKENVVKILYDTLLNNDNLDPTIKKYMQKYNSSKDYEKHFTGAFLTRMKDIHPDYSLNNCAQILTDILNDGILLKSKTGYYNAPYDIYSQKYEIMIPCYVDKEKETITLKTMLNFKDNDTKMKRYVLPVDSQTTEFMSLEDIHNMLISQNMDNNYITLKKFLSNV